MLWTIVPVTHSKHTQSMYFLVLYYHYHYSQCFFYIISISLLTNETRKEEKNIWDCQFDVIGNVKTGLFVYTNMNIIIWGFFECCLRGRVHDDRMASMLFRAELPYACWMYISLYLIWVWGMEFMYIITIIIASGIVENFVLPNVTRIFRKYLLYQYYIILFTLNRSIYFHSVYADVVLCHMPCICCHIVAWNFCSLKLCWICSA